MTLPLSIPQYDKVVFFRPHRPHLDDWIVLETTFVKQRRVAKPADEEFGTGLCEVQSKDVSKSVLTEDLGDDRFFVAEGQGGESKTKNADYLNSAQKFK